MIDSLKDFDSENELDDEDSIDKSSSLYFNHLSDLEDQTNTWNFQFYECVYLNTLYEGFSLLLVDVQRGWFYFEQKTCIVTIQVSHLLLGVNTHS